MLYAIDRENKISGAIPGLIAFCLICKSKMIPKCGAIKIWHWAHSSKRDCDNWADVESDWHRSGKLLFPKESCEVVVTKEGVRHRADVKLFDGTVIKFQKKTLTEIEMNQRKEFYGERLLWLFNASTRGNKFPDYYKYFNCLYARDSRLSLDTKLYYDFQRPEVYCTFRDIIDNPNFILDFTLLKEYQKENHKQIQELDVTTVTPSSSNSLSDENQTKIIVNSETEGLYTYFTIEELSNLSDYWDSELYIRPKIRIEEIDDRFLKK